MLPLLIGFAEAGLRARLGPEIGFVHVRTAFDGLLACTS